MLGVKASAKHTPLTHGNANDATSARSVPPSPKSQEAKLDPGENENDDTKTGRPGRPKKEKVVDLEKAAEKAAKVTLLLGRRSVLTGFADLFVS